MDNTDTRINKQIEMLDNWEQDKGIIKMSIPPDIEFAFGLTYQQIEKLTPEQCSYYSYALAQYSVYIQQIYNVESAKYKSIHNEINRLTSNKLGDYEFTKYEVKIQLIANENVAVNNLFNKLHLQEQKLERLNYIASGIKTVSESMLNIQRVKKTWQQN